ncbi:MAG TPA: tetratricopeptide repeat protein [Opitutaceae bacterium]|nr:tetratricopeptide repeat protein [Opitutaceae bacterium]
MNRPVPPGRDAAAWFAAAAIVVLTLAAYATGLRGAFVYDDVAAITHNPTLRHFSWAAVVPPADVTTSGRPLLNLTLAANHALGGLAVTGYHLFNVAVQAAAGLLLFGLVRRTLGTAPLVGRFGAAALPLAFVTALAWAVHPLETEAVSYVVQRAESLMGLFFLGTLYGFVRAATSPRPRGWLFGSVASCLLGVVSKEVIYAAPLLVLLYDRTFVSGSFADAWGRRRGYYLALFGTWIPLLLLVASTGWNRGGTVGLGVDVPWWAYAATQFRALTHYLALSVWPHPLVFDYGTRWETAWLPVLPRAVVVVAVMAGTLWALRCRPVAGFLGMAFLLPLAPTSLLPGVTQMIVEHRMYLSLAPVLALLVAGTFTLAGRRGLIAVAGVALAGAALTARRNCDYRSDLALWRDTVAKAPANAAARCNLAIALVQRGELAPAISEYEVSLRLAPDASNTRYNYGLALAKAGRLEDAVRQYRAALRLVPNLADARCNLGTALLALGRPADALPELERARALRPEDVDVLADLGAAQAQTGHVPAAIRSFQQALALRPDDADLHYNLGTALFSNGDRRSALMQFEAADRLRPNDPDITHNLNLARGAP